MNTKRIGAAGAAFLAAARGRLRQQRVRLHRRPPAPAPPRSTRAHHRDDHGRRHEQADLPALHARQAARLLRQGRLNVNLVDEPAGGDATENMLAGQVQGVGGFYDHNIALQAQGKSSEAVVSMLQIPGEVELCRSDLKGAVKSPADFKGRSLGITDTGSSTDFLTQYLARRTASTRRRRPPRRRRRSDLHRRA